MKASSILLLSFLTSSISHAVVLSETKLPDGRQIQIHDDFTWSYVLTEVSAKSAPVAQSSGATSTPTPSAVLTPQAIADPAMLGTIAADGVKLTLQSTQKNDDQLGLNIQVSNLATGSVVKILGLVSFYSQQGQLLAQHEVSFWQAEYRLPDTYLRTQQTRPFRTLWLPMPDGNQAPLIRLEITSVERRS